MNSMPSLNAEISELAAQLGTRLIARRETIVVSESSAGGLISAALVAQAGASAYYIGGCVVYTAAAREALVGIDLSSRPGLRSATEAMAALIAHALRNRLGAVWGLAETGASGPSGNRYGDAAGHCCLAIDGPVSTQLTLETGRPERTENMQLFTRAALELALRTLG